MTKMARIFKAAMEIIDSIHRDSWLQKKKKVYKHKHIRRILASSQNHRAWKVWPRKWRTSKKSEAWLKPCHRNSLHTPTCACCWVHLHHNCIQRAFVLGPPIRREHLRSWAQIVFHKDRRLSEDLTPPFRLL